MLALPVLAATVVYALIGAIILAVAFMLWDRLTPAHLWNEISQKQNVAVAILAGAVAIGLSLIIAAAIHG